MADIGGVAVNSRRVPFRSPPLGEVVGGSGGGLPVGLDGEAEPVFEPVVLVCGLGDALDG